MEGGTTSMATTTSHPRSPSFIAQVRALMPARPLTQSEGLRVGALPMSGYTTWSRGRWLIVLNHAEPLTRQRFSLFHETKHLVDHPFIADAYRQVQGQSPENWAETVCDYFAACVLMPKAWVKRSYCYEGIQQLPTLARQFGVSQVAMRTRLLHLGLVEPTPRCRYRRASDGHLLTPGLGVAA